jgi:transposase-like protein
MGRSKKARQCPRCASKDVILQDSFDDGYDLYVCADCDFEFEVGGSGSKRSQDYEEFDDDLDPETSEEEWEN